MQLEDILFPAMQLEVHTIQLWKGLMQSSLSFKENDMEIKQY